LKVEYNEETSVRKSLTFEIEPGSSTRRSKRARDYARKVGSPASARAGFRRR
jgi:hypothetical protein